MESGPIRIATAEEFPAIEGLLHRAYAPVLAAMSAEHADNFREAFSTMVMRYGEKGTWFVTGPEVHLTGCVAYFAPNSVEHRLFQANWAHIQLLGVDTEFTGCGLGRMLMRHCLSVTRTTGARTLALQTSELMNPARRLYESLGFLLERTLEPAFGHPTYLYLHREP